MLDPKFIKENIDKVSKAAKDKGMTFESQTFLSLFESRNTLIKDVEELRQKRKQGSNLVKGEKDASKRQALIQDMKVILEKLNELEKKLSFVEKDFYELLVRVPSIPSKESPVGASDKDNVEFKKVGDIPKFDFEPHDHITLSRKLKLVDFERGTKVAGSRSYFLTGQGARLERALHLLTIDLLYKKNYRELSVPSLVKSEALFSTGYLPIGADQAYYIEKDKLWLIGTSEVSLASFYQNEIIDEEDLPIKLFAASTCFRREAGAHGKDTKGLYRVHEFKKVEQVIVCSPFEDISNKLHEELFENAEELLALLELPYRAVHVCTGDLGQGQVKKYDIEVWMPSRHDYGETHSCSSFYDFQARRLKLRMREAGTKQIKHCYTLNNTAIATPRILIPFLENHQTKEGTIRIPKALQKYMGNEEYIK